MVIHVVAQGESLDSIAEYYGVSAARIITDNGLNTSVGLVIGQSLVILFPETTHTVKAGETITSVSQAYGITPVELIRNNPVLLIRRFLYEGEMLTISFKGEKLGTLNVNGYAYPHIDTNVLMSTLPYLSRLTVFGYGFTKEGELIPINDDYIISLAIESGVKPIMLLNTVTEGGNFSTENANIVMSSPELSQHLINNIIAKMKQKGYRGLDVDFEFIDPNYAESYYTFLNTIGPQLRQEGFSLNVDLAPKTSSNQRGLLYEAHDYQRIGSAADTVLLMTYEWGYTYGPPMAVAPINKVEEVVSYALTEIPPQKIFMGIPNYGYDWALPFQRGVTRAVTLGNMQAIQTAAFFGAVIQYDQTAQTPFFTYSSGGVDHIVWFEDARSIDAKLRLANANGLLGVGYWNITRPFPQNWALLNSLFYIQSEG